MSILNNLTGSGFSGQSAQAILGKISYSLTATGTTQTTAYKLSSDVSEFSSVPVNAGALLPVSVNGNRYTVMNSSTQAILVYPPVGGVISILSDNAPYTIAAGYSGDFIGAGNGKYLVLYSPLLNDGNIKINGTTQSGATVKPSWALTADV